MVQSKDLDKDIRDPFFVGQTKVTLTEQNQETTSKSITFAARLS